MKLVIGHAKTHREVLMKKLLLAITFLLVPLLFLGGCAAAPPYSPNQNSLLGHSLLGPAHQNAYGLGVHSDAAGRPFRWVPQGAPSSFNDPLLKVKPNAYGLGVGADQYGRPVQAVPLY